jgi:hypothetical protein
LEAEFKERSQKKLKAVIQKLEADLNDQRQKILDDAERRVNAAGIEARRAVAALETEKGSHQTEVMALQQDVKAEKTLNTRLELENDRLSQEVEHQRQMKTKLQTEIGEREKEIMGLKLEMQKRVNSAMESTESQVRDVQVQLEDSRKDLTRKQTEWEAERKQAEESHAAELAALSVKVKTLIEGKENTIQTLKDQLLAAQNRLREIEQLFHQQKKSILAAKK